jgi:intracellular multiplication protein IcmP
MSDGKKRDKLQESMLLIAGVVVLYFLASHFFGREIAYGWWWWQSLKADVVQLVYNFETLRLLDEVMAEPRNWGDVTALQSWKVADIVNGYFRWLFVPLIGWWAWIVYNKNPLHGLKNFHTTKSLIASEVAVWPHVKPIERLDLLSEPSDKGAWASGKNPIEFARKYKLIMPGTTELNKERALKLFAAQLAKGKVWSGAKNLPPLTKALFVIFAAQGNWNAADPNFKGAKDEAREGINRLALSYHKNPKIKRLDYEWMDKIIEKHANHPDVLEVTSKHAYVYTVMMSMLLYARRNGVLPSSEFFWVRHLDRTLWYSLNNVGRYTAWAEIAGIYGHWLAEKVSEGPMVRPYVQKAVEALADGLKNIKFKIEAINNH